MDKCIPWSIMRNMPARSPPVKPELGARLRRLGAQIRARREALAVSAATTAESAGMSRTTLHRIERGEASVTIGAWASAAAAIGLTLELVAPSDRRAEVKGQAALPEHVRLEDYPELSVLAWQRDRSVPLTPREALDLYERNWHHIDHDAMSPRERRFLEVLVRELGGGRPLV
jgi:transcriptional regulator with XRE-family HTH domain